MTTARNSQPSSVGMKVISPTHTELGVATWKLRSSRLGPIGRPCRLSVVAIRETALAACPNAMPRHQPLHPLFAYADAPVAQFSPNAWPPVGSPILRKYSADGNQHCLIAQVSALENMPAASKVFMIAGHAHPEHPALHADGATRRLGSIGVLHFRSFAKYAVAFPRMSRSILTRASSARNRAFSICRALAAVGLSAPFSVH